MPFCKTSKRKHSKHGPTKVIDPSVTQHDRSPSPISLTDCPPRPKSLKIEPDDSVSTTVCDLVTPPPSVTSKANESAKPCDMNTLNSLPQSLHNILSQLVNQASTPSPLTPNKVFNPKSISEEQIQIGMKFDDILSSLFHQSQPQQNLQPTSSTVLDSNNQGNSVLSINHANLAANLAASLGTNGINSGTLSLINAITQASQSSAQITSVPNSNSMQVTIPIQTVFNHQNLSNPLSAMLQSQFLIQQPQVQQQSAASNATLNLITSLGNGTTSSGNAAVTLQPIICNNPTINGIPLLLSVTDPNSSNSQTLRPVTSANNVMINKPNQPSLIQPAPSQVHISTLSQASHQTQVAHQATSQLLASAANSGKPSTQTFTIRTDSVYEHVASADIRQSLTSINNLQQRQGILPAINRGNQNNTNLLIASSASSLNGQLSKVAPAPSGAQHIQFTHVEEIGMKLERKRARNRDAARKCREKKITLISTLEEELSALEKHYESLVRQAEMEESEVNQLRTVLVDHRKCGCDVSFPLTLPTECVSSTTAKIGTC